MNVTTYNANDCTVIVGGENGIAKTYITGLGEDMISFEKEEAFFEPIVGAQGDVVKSEINNSLYNLTITIQPTSPQKSFLLGLLKTSATYPVWVINKALNERMGGTMASIKEMPEIARGAEAEDMEFTFCVFDGVVEECGAEIEY